MLSFYKINTYHFRDREIICFGVEESGRSLLDIFEVNFLKYNFRYFTDWNIETAKESIRGTRAGCSSFPCYYKDGIPIISYIEAIMYLREHKSAILLIASSNYEEVYKKLIEEEIENDILARPEFVNLFLREFVNEISKMVDEDFISYYMTCRRSHRDALVPLWTMLTGKKENKPLIFVIATPKTGNTSLCTSLEQKEALHFRLNGIIPTGVFDCGWVKFLKDYPLKLIIGVREPVAQNISALFECNGRVISIRRNINDMDAQKMFDEKVVNDICDRKSLEYPVESEVVSGNLFHEYLVQNFFYGEIKNILGIDIFAHEFNKQAGYSIFKQDNMEIFIYRLENLNGLTKEIGDFCGIENFQLVTSNVGFDKFYNKPYKQFIEGVTFPREYLDKTYQSEFMHHFYTDEEIRGFYKKWEKHVR